VLLHYYGILLLSTINLSSMSVKLIYSEKAIKILENFHCRFGLYNIGQIYDGDFTNFVAFSEYMNFKALSNTVLSYTGLADARFLTDFQHT
jgi:hypothetical protein